MGSGVGSTVQYRRTTVLSAIGCKCPEALRPSTRRVGGRPEAPACPEGGLSTFVPRIHRGTFRSAMEIGSAFPEISTMNDRSGLRWRLDLRVLDLAKGDGPPPGRPVAGKSGSAMVPGQAEAAPAGSGLGASPSLPSSPSSSSSEGLAAKERWSCSSLRVTLMASPSLNSPERRFSASGSSM